MHPEIDDELKGMYKIKNVNKAGYVCNYMKISFIFLTMAFKPFLCENGAKSMLSFRFTPKLCPLF